MFGLFLFIAVIFAIWLGAHLSGLEHVDIWRCLTVAFIGSLVSILLGFLLFPLHFIPLLNSVLSIAVLLFSTAFAAKLVLSCSANQAWVISGVAAVASMIMHALFRHY